MRLGAGYIQRELKRDKVRVTTLALQACPAVGALAGAAGGASDRGAGGAGRRAATGPVPAESGAALVVGDAEVTVVDTAGEHVAAGRGEGQASLTGATALLVGTRLGGARAGATSVHTALRAAVGISPARRPIGNAARHTAARDVLRARRGAAAAEVRRVAEAPRNGADVAASVDTGARLAVDIAAAGVARVSLAEALRRIVGNDDALPAAAVAVLGAERVPECKALATPAIAVAVAAIGAALAQAADRAAADTVLLSNEVREGAADPVAAVGVQGTMGHLPSLRARASADPAVAVEAGAVGAEQAGFADGLAADLFAAAAAAFIVAVALQGEIEASAARASGGSCAGAGATGRAPGRSLPAAHVP